jgi:NYN domain-containing protein
MNPNKPVTALLIDADNVSTEVVAEVLRRLQPTHALQHRRAYGSVQKATEFAALAQDHAIRFLPSTFAGPNATDLALAIDAVELVLRERPDEVVLVSSDRDFAPLVVWLREQGCRVTGFGQHGKSAGDIARDYLRVYDAFEVIGGGKPRSRAKPAARTAVDEDAPKPAAKRGRRAPAAKKKAAPALPEAVVTILDACPDLRAGPMRLDAACRVLREQGVLTASGRPSMFFKRLSQHFELLPPDKPDTVRFLGA